MSADFWAGYISGAMGIIIGNPLDILKVRLQAHHQRPHSSNVPIGENTPLLSTRAPSASFNISRYQKFRNVTRSLVSGTGAPVLGYGALNALLFVSYNRSELALVRIFGVQERQDQPRPLWAAWVGGAFGGLGTWFVSAPTELIKCRVQLSSPPQSSWDMTRQILRAEGLRGLYFGGLITALRDSVGYGFYFWSYELSTRSLAVGNQQESGKLPSTLSQDVVKVLLCGGLAGVVTWASIFPLDVIKTRLQTQSLEPAATALLGGRLERGNRSGSIDIARAAYREGGLSVFFRGLAVCTARAFMVNAVQWAMYEWVMQKFGHGRQKLPEPTV